MFLLTTHKLTSSPSLTNKAMPSLKYDSDSDDTTPAAAILARPLDARERLRNLLGRGKVADLLTWKNKNLSAGVLAGATFIWFLFEVVEYHFLTLLSHISITVMLVMFIWSNAAALVDGVPPKIPEAIVSEHAFREAAMSFHKKLSQFLWTLHDIACGKDLKLFLQTIASLWIISVIGSYCSSITLLYLGFLCAQTLPVLYERYGEEVDHLANRGRHDLKKIYKKVDSKVLKKIPRGPVKNNKLK